MRDSAFDEVSMAAKVKPLSNANLNVSLLGAVHWENGTHET